MRKITLFLPIISIFTACNSPENEKSSSISASTVCGSQAQEDLVEQLDLSATDSIVNGHRLRTQFVLDLRRADFELGEKKFVFDSTATDQEILEKWVSEASVFFQRNRELVERASVASQELDGIVQSRLLHFVQEAQPNSKFAQFKDYVPANSEIRSRFRFSSDGNLFFERNLEMLNLTTLEKDASMYYFIKIDLNSVTTRTNANGASSYEASINYFGVLDKAP